MPRWTMRRGLRHRLRRLRARVPARERRPRQLRGVRDGLPRGDELRVEIKTGDDDDPDKEKIDIRHSGDGETDLQKQAGRIRRQILSANDLDELGLAWADNSVTLDHIKLMSEVAYDFLSKEYHRKKELIENG